MSNLDWQAIRTAYEGGTSSLSALEREFGVSRQAIKKRASKENWGVTQLQVTVTSPKQRVPNRDVNAALRAAKALDLRAKKLTYQQIADLCGYSDASTCRKAIMRELDRVVVEKVDELRREESYILDRIHTRLYEAALDETNEGWQWAADRVMNLSKARRELMGLDKRPDENANAPQVVVREVPVGWLQIPQTVEASHE